MSKIIPLIIGFITIILYLADAWIIIQANANHKLLTLLPVIAHNQPQGGFGWLVVATIVATIGLFISLSLLHK
ncbi:hypothetical protein [Lactobacillus sp. Sy-1]|uniref:hypothetical protein n=1 Tax=Lactobacillus sp. Sy-1 TaxID=2109645 RepID=UPI001C5B0D1C|nr:hypothetical protein [Lactobacillus sp. Sy-1]MBW1605948.1 hypothetical protein [Lactobacillus sp. Sy-1]